MVVGDNIKPIIPSLTFVCLGEFFLYIYVFLPITQVSFLLPQPLFSSYPQGYCVASLNSESLTFLSFRHTRMTWDALPLKYLQVRLVLRSSNEFSRNVLTHVWYSPKGVGVIVTHVCIN